MVELVKVCQKYGKVNAGKEKGMFWVRLGGSEKIYCNSFEQIINILFKQLSDTNKLLIV